MSICRLLLIILSIATPLVTGTEKKKRSTFEWACGSCCWMKCVSDTQNDDNARHVSPTKLSQTEPRTLHFKQSTKPTQNQNPTPHPTLQSYNLNLVDASVDSLVPPQSAVDASGSMLPQTIDSLDLSQRTKTAPASGLLLPQTTESLKAKAFHKASQSRKLISPEVRKPLQKPKDDSLQKKILDQCLSMISFVADDTDDLEMALKYCHRRFGELINKKNDNASYGDDISVIALDLNAIVHKTNTTSFRNQQEVEDGFRRVYDFNAAGHGNVQCHVVKHNDEYAVHSYRKYFMDFIKKTQERHEMVGVYIYLDSEMDTVLTRYYDVIVVELQCQFEFAFVTVVKPASSDKKAMNLYPSSGNYKSITIMDTLGEHSMDAEELSNCTQYFAPLLVPAASSALEYPNDMFWAQVAKLWTYPKHDIKIKAEHKQLKWMSCLWDEEEQLPRYAHVMRVFRQYLQFYKRQNQHSSNETLSPLYPCTRSIVR
eukprot:415634_1